MEIHNYLYTLSIIIPLYNSSKVIKKTLDSIIKVTKKHENEIEIVLVDDGSADDTSDKCRQFMRDHKNIFYYKKSNGGIADARNYGVQKANGKYLFFHDHDDCLWPNDFCSIMSLIKNENRDIYFFEVFQSTKNGLAKYIYNKNIDEANSTKNCILIKDFILNLSHSRGGKNYVSKTGQIWATIVSSSFVQNNNISFVRIVGYEDDFLFLLQYILKKPSIYISNYSIYVYNINDESTSRSYKYDNDVLNKISILNSFLQSLFSKNDYLTNCENYITNILWGFYYEFFVTHYCLTNKDRNIKEFKLLCLKYNIRAILGFPKKRVLSAKQLFISLLFKLNFIGIVFRMFVFRYSVKKMI